MFEKLRRAALFQYRQMVLRLSHPPASSVLVVLQIIGQRSVVHRVFFVVFSFVRFGLGRGSCLSFLLCRFFGFANGGKKSLMVVFLLERALFEVFHQLRASYGLKGLMDGFLIFCLKRIVILVPATDTGDVP